MLREKQPIPRSVFGFTAPAGLPCGFGDTFGTVALEQGLCSPQESGGDVGTLPVSLTVTLLHQFISFHETFSNFRTLTFPLCQLKEANELKNYWSGNKKSHYCGQHNCINYVNLLENLAWEPNIFTDKWFYTCKTLLSGELGGDLSTGLRVSMMGWAGSGPASLSAHAHLGLMVIYAVVKGSFLPPRTRKPQLVAELVPACTSSHGQPTAASPVLSPLHPSQSPGGFATGYSSTGSENSRTRSLSLFSSSVRSHELRKTQG